MVAMVSRPKRHTLGVSETLSIQDLVTWLVNFIAQFFLTLQSFLWHDNPVFIEVNFFQSIDHIHLQLV